MSVPGSTGVETAEVVEPWLWDLLETDRESGALGTLGVEAVVNTATTGDDPDSGTDQPGVDRWVVFTLVSARDVRGVGLVRSQVDAIYQVKAVVTGESFDPARAIFARICQLIETPETVTTESGSLTCHRETITQYPELQDGTHYRHLGGTFRVRTSAT